MGAIITNMHDSTTMIESDVALKQFCQRAVQHRFIALDTEFVRTSTLKPNLGLIQAATSQETVLIDPLPITDFVPLIALLSDTTIIKVLHACSEDMEVFFNAFSVIPVPVFDTQFAAALLGMGNALGYSALVEKQLNVRLDKGETRTDWLARPLSEAQLGYAANDVHYLQQMFAKLENAIVSKGLNQWVYTESELLGTKKKMQLAADYQYLKLKHNWQLQGQSLHALKHLASWRFLQSQQENKPINFIVKEPVLVEICRLMPTHKGALWSVSGMHSSTIKVYAEPLLEQIRQSMQVAAEAYPPPIQRLIDFPDYKNAMAELKKYSGRLANDYQVPVEVICSKKQAHQLLKYLWFDLDETRLAGLTPDLLSGWRAELFKPCLQQSVYLKE